MSERKGTAMHLVVKVNEGKTAGDGERGERRWVRATCQSQPSNVVVGEAVAELGDGEALIGGVEDFDQHAAVLREAIEQAIANERSGR